MSDFWGKFNALISADTSSEESEAPRLEKKFWKFRLVLFSLMFGLFLVVVRLFYIQVINVEQFQDKAKNQHETRFELPASRGIITDRNGKAIATNVNSLSIAVDPKILKNDDEICNIISKSLGYSLSNLKKKVSNKSRRFVWLARGIEPALINDIYQIEDKGLILIEEPKRIYPYGSVASQIVGYTNIDNKGISGLEYQYNEDLQGKSGYMIMRKDALQNLYAAPDLPKIPPRNGKNIQLTIDIDFQRIVQHELAKGIEFSMADAGIAVAIRPNTGEILAICNYPFFDPNKRSTIKGSKTKLRAITDEYAPGSTFKLMTVASALQEEIVSEKDSVYGFNGEMVFSWGRIRDVHGFGPATFEYAVWQSSNIVMANTAQQIPDKKWYAYLRNFGFGHKTEIDLPGEIAGKLKKPKDFNKSSKRYMGHGYDLTCTPLQVANAYATVANDGNMMQNHIIEKIYDDEETYFENKVTKIRRVIKGEIANRIDALFVGVVDSGSGKRAKVKEMKIAGKTGTSQKLNEFGRYSKSEYYASFAGYFPAENPEVALVIIVDTPRKSIYGGFNAAPIFKRIAQRWMNLYYKPEIQIVKSDSISVPSFIGLDINDAKELATRSNLTIESTTDKGLCFYQNPKAGQTVPIKSKIRVTLSNPKNKDNSKIDLRGFGLSNALNLLHSRGVVTKVRGKGKVKNQRWFKENNQLICELTCSL